ncbi:biopolymer transporter ExbD [Brevundimonas basaltis]|uniref:Biopolymer transport protein ExbD n=1 Tax=Brevundimonas basaltis TaxID=472166 RepID=A0A7W8MI63_9CAUL|nr:biopolymer transporter ExbD [Brevundimonas basaltis]MBB5292962.1 biopolymer transport protein ExbD [Brevundimonas basaltis]
MAAKLSGGGGGKYAIEQNSEINVTPFVDIMLVLLIIFMVAAPLATVSVEVKLPVAVAPMQQNPPKPFYVSIQANSRVYLGDDEVDIDSVGSELLGQIGNKVPSDERIFIRADQTTRYGDFMQVMNSLQDSGFYSVALVGEDQSAE